MLWHIGHHISRGQSVDEAWPHIASDIGHVHFSMNPGGKADEADNARTFELLGSAGFDGFFSVEVINPDDPRAVLQHHIDAFNRFLPGASA